MELKTELVTNTDNYVHPLDILGVVIISWTAIDITASGSVSQGGENLFSMIITVNQNYPSVLTHRKVVLP